MQLIIREYLAQLKESGELDRILPDLLLSMRLTPLSRPQVGTRQDGVDIAAVGKDEDGVKTLFLFTVKRGDIARNDWAGGPQDVRASLDDILDIYLATRIDPQHKKLRKKVILCTGGDLKQAVEPNWIAYNRKYTKQGKLEFDFWGGDKLAILIEKHLFNENVLPEKLRAKFRRVLALLSEPDQSLQDYYAILNELLSSKELKGKSSAVKKKIYSTFRTINLCQSIIYFWAKQAENLKPAMLSSERTVLNLWNSIITHKLEKDTEAVRAFVHCHQTLMLCYGDYYQKIEKLCYTVNGLHGYGNHAAQEAVNIFEHLGFLGIFASLHWHLYQLTKNDQSLQNCKIIVRALQHLICNHSAASAPCYDRHINEISIAINLIVAHADRQFVEDWILQIVDNISFSYAHMGKYFPISTDSFDDLVAICVSDAVDKEKLFNLSTLLPILAYWCVTLNLEKPFKVIRENQEKFYPQCTFEVWNPDSKTEKTLYIQNAAYASGALEAPIKLGEFSEMKTRLETLNKNVKKIKNFSCLKNGLAHFPLLASRHFQSPPFPQYWLQYLDIAPSVGSDS